MNFKKLNNIVGWSVFAIALIVYILSAEATGSLWDCGEFIAAANKLQVVHPPGAPLFILVGRMFTYVAELFSNNPADIAYAVNVMSGVCTAFAVLFIFWTTTILSKLALVGRTGDLSKAQTVAVLGAGTAAGLAGTFATSVWFSAVEGEVYAMSTFFTSLVLWATMKWYNLPEGKHTDKWLIFAAYMAGLSIGVHLLSLLVFPTMAILFYLKKYKTPTWKGVIAATGAGVVVLGLVQAFIILRLPKVGSAFELLFVNSFGMGFGSGFTFFLILLVAAVGFGLYWAHTKKKPIMHRALIAFSMVLIGFSTYGVVIIRANANPPINMNNPSDVFTLVSYLNREQYGDRPLIRGPHFKAQPVSSESEDRYGPVGDHYEVVDQKISYVYNPSDYVMFPRMGHYDKKAQHQQWMKYFGMNENGIPNGAYNLRYMLRYQVGWMYWRYFMWNFVGRQNGDQGYYPWTKKSGHWLSGIKAIDSGRLYNQSNLPETIEKHQARNTYYFLPLIFGLLGFFYAWRKRKWDTVAILALFLISGLGIIVQSNQPPQEPRERDYVLVGSILMYCVWIGMGVLALFEIFMRNAKLAQLPSAVLATALVLTAPAIMGFQNWDDHNRSEHVGARDYAINFLESCQPNAIVFTHGDNDTYPLWYAQEVENIRPDVRVVNLSLLAVDWYIDQLRRKVNSSPAIKLSIPKEQLRGPKRNSLMYSERDVLPAFTNIANVVKYMGEDHPRRTQGGRTIESVVPTKKISIPVNKAAVLANHTVSIADSARIVDNIRFTLNKNSLIKDEITILDIIASNNWERPIYFAVTCKPEKALGLADYLQLEGMALRLVPVKSKSDGNFGFVGSGSIAIDTMYNNIMTKFKWGNFDKERLFVDRSYQPSVVSMRLGMIRLTRALIAKGDNERAVKVIDKYFEAYPHMNFAYDYNALYLIREYFNASAPEKAKEHLRILAYETADHMEFYNSLDATDRKDFEFEERQASGTMQETWQLIQRVGDTDLINEINQIFNLFMDTGQSQTPPPPVSVPETTGQPTE